jgi:hypothetical protein
MKECDVLLLDKLDDAKPLSAALYDRRSPSAKRSTHSVAEVTEMLSKGCHVGLDFYDLLRQPSLASEMRF